MARVPWSEISATLGFNTREEMLITLYKNMGVKAISDKLGVYSQSVRRILIKNGVTLRKPGGANNYKHGRYSKKKLVNIEG